MTISQALLVGISGAAIGGMLVRPFRSREWVWTLGGAVALVAGGLLPVDAALAAIVRGADVYAFLIGIMALAELARHQRLFAWAADRLLRAGRGSRGRLFLLVYGAGALVTVVLSNDTTAVVLTPAVYAALARTKTDPLPYLFACAFVANAASFVLPISNPANLVVFGHALPMLRPWIATFGFPALAAVLLTYATLRIAYARTLATSYAFDGDAVALTRSQRRAAFVIAGATLGLIVAATLGVNVGYAAIGLAALAIAATALDDVRAARFVGRHLAWHVVPLVAGLFVIVVALDRAGALELARAALLHAQSAGSVWGTLFLGGAVTLASTLFNNLPVALAGGFALQTLHASAHLSAATLVAVDLGPNLSITGSLATVLWLIAIRRDGLEVTAWQFFRLGLAVVAPALAASLLLLR